MRIEFFVPGIPVPQGSKRAFVNKKTGRAIVVDDNAKTKPWRREIIDEAQRAKKAIGDIAGDQSWLAGPLLVEIRFSFPRPTGHFGRHGLRPTAPIYPAVRPDLDKLVRAVLDALKGAGLFADDSRVVVLAVSKHYVDPILDESPGALIRVSPPPDWDARPDLDKRDIHGEIAPLLPLPLEPQEAS